MSTERPVDRAPRYAITLSAEVRTAEFASAGLTRNVSTGGICVDIDRPLAEGAAVDVTLFLVEDEIESEGKRGLDLKATVQWTAEGDRGHSIGLRFVDPAPDKLAMLERVLSMIAPS